MSGNLGYAHVCANLRRQVLAGLTCIPADPLALYVHIPFCATKCPYCDFNTYAGIEHLIPSYVNALAEEIRLWGAALANSSPPSYPSPLEGEGTKNIPPPLTGEGEDVSQSVATIFFGGGTPSYLPPQNVERVLDAVRSVFSLDADAEVTLESNPDDVTPDRLETWKRAGVNRLSIGVQSLDDDLLHLLGRRHTAAKALQAYQAARQAGFDNVNLDLMYGLPHQTLAQWENTLTTTLALRPEHISLYCLTLEEGTSLEVWVRQGTVPAPDSDLAADMYLLAEKLAGDAGYEHYEISNWALPGQACRHNLTYWRNQPYLGVGPGAHSWLGGHRFANLRSPRQYIAMIGRMASATESPAAPGSFQEYGVVDMAEAIDHRLEKAETMILGLRLAEGVMEKEFRQRFGVGLADSYGAQISELEGLGLLEWHDGRLRLTSRGRLLGNEVFLRFLTP